MLWTEFGAPRQYGPEIKYSKHGKGTALDMDPKTKAYFDQLLEEVGFDDGDTQSGVSGMPPGIPHD